MADLTFVTWLWGEKYSRDYVRKLEAGIARHYGQDFNFLCEGPRRGEEHLLKGCFVRLKMFDPAWQESICLKPGDRMVCMDLDCVITGPLDDLFDRGGEPFTILQGVNAVNPCPFNGSLWMLEAGYRPDVWHEFSLDLAAKVPFHEFPDDQAWLADMLPDAGSFGPQDGVYAFQKRGWPKGEALPGNARIVAFPGWRDPSQYVRLDWVAEHWRA